MPKYQCPECETTLKRENPVPEGKKIKCPKCEVVFLPEPVREAKAQTQPAAKKAKAAKPAPDEDEEGGSYGMASDPKESESDEKARKKKKDVNYGSLRDKFEKSKRGPAMAKLVKLTNGMLFIGVITVIGGIVGMVFGLWPFVFSENMPKGSAARNQIFTTLGALAVGIYGGCMCYGASKMHELESYGWSMVGSVLTSIFGVISVLAGLGIGFKAATAEADDGFMTMITGLGAFAVLAWGGFACNVGLKSMSRLKEDMIKEGYEETEEMIEY